MSIWILRAFLFWKIILAVGILSAFLSDIQIYRKDLTTSNGFSHGKRFNKYSFPFNFRQHFCAKPKSTLNITKDEMMHVLDLPTDSVISEDLSTFGRCLYVERDSANPNTVTKCVCFTKPGYITLITVSALSVIVNLAHILGSSVLKRYECNVTFYGYLAWSIAVAMATCDHLTWSDHVWLSDSLYEQSYFLKPMEWTLALALCMIYIVLGVFEFVATNPMRYANLDAENRLVAKDDRSFKTSWRRIVFLEQFRELDFDESSWSVEETSDAMRRRYHQGRHPEHPIREKLRFCKSWP